MSTTLGRYWSLWRTLDPEERRVRAGRVLERSLRRRPLVRRLGLAPDQPRWSALRRATHGGIEPLVTALRGDDASRGPLFRNLDASASAIVERAPQHADRLFRTCDELLERRFDLLGTGSARPLREDGGIDWHLDWRSGSRWDARAHYVDLRVVRGDGSDVKVPWELARFQHLLVLGQAYRLAAARLEPADADRLRRRTALEAREQIDDWIVANPRGLGIHWTCAMEVAIRAYNWLAALALLRDAPEWDDAFVARLVRSLWVHGRFIRRHLEIGSGGVTSNHYLSDVIGLYALGCALPELRDSASWRATGHAALCREIETQVLADGVDYERSLPYHRLVAEMFAHGALLARCRGDEVPAAYLDRLARMLEVTAACTRRDGTVAQWGDNDDGRLLPLDGYASHEPNDHRHLLALGGSLLGRDDLAALGAARPVEAIWLLGERPATERSPVAYESHAFPAAGLYLTRHDDLHGIIPCGPVGTGGIGNHSHNDLLSISVWADGTDWIVDPGSGGYTGDLPLRNRMRSTAAHATVQLGRLEQNPFAEDVDGLFRLHDRARPEVLRWSCSGGRVELDARHRGFSTDRVTRFHERRIRFDGSGRSWVVLDRLTDADGPVTVRFPLHPAVSARPSDDWPEPLRELLDVGAGELTASLGTRSAWRLDHEGARLWVACALPTGAETRCASGLHSPRYGVTEKTSILEATVETKGEFLAVTVVWSPGRDR